MRAGSLVALLAGILVACGSAAAGDESEAAAKAKLRLAGGAPLTIRGTDFKSRERVRLIVVESKKVTKTLTATEGGAFVVRFRGLALDKCQGFTAFAVGSRGSRASVSSPNVYCPPRP